MTNGENTSNQSGMFVTQSAERGSRVELGRIVGEVDAKTEHLLMVERRQPPFEGIRDALTNGNVIPFLGSGASLSDDEELSWADGADDCFPTAKQLAKHLANKGNYPKEVKTHHASDFRSGERSESDVERDEPGPTGDVAEELPEDPWIPELRKAAQYIALTMGRDPLVNYLEKIFRATPALGRLQRYLAELSTPAGAPLIIVTTNYDDLLERAFDEADKNYLLVVHTTGRDRGEKLLVRGPDGEYREEDSSDITQTEDLDAVIYKMHGSIRRGNGETGEYVITDDDYVDFLARMTRWTAIPAVINQPLKLKHFLFLGYGLEDWNLRVLLSQLADAQIQKQGHLKNWAIQKGPSLFDQEYWANKGVKVYDMTIDAFLSGLETTTNPSSP